MNGASKTPSRSPSESDEATAETASAPAPSHPPTSCAREAMSPARTAAPHAEPMAHPTWGSHHATPKAMPPASRLTATEGRMRRAVQAVGGSRLTHCTAKAMTPSAPTSTSTKGEFSVRSTPQATSSTGGTRHRSHSSQDTPQG